MRLHEHEGKRLFKQWGIPIPQGEIATTPAAVRSIANSLGRPVMVKAQVRTGGRGNGGGIASASTPKEAALAAQQLLGTILQGETVRTVLVEEQLYPLQELYLGVALDKSLGQLAVIVSRDGGVDIEQKVQSSAERTAQMPLDPLEPFQPFMARHLASRVGLSGRPLLSVGDALHSVVQGVLATDLLLAEVNPLFLLPDASVVAGDAKVEICDDALFRHPEFAKSLEQQAADDISARADAAGLAFVPLQGDIGIVGGGAGLCMATMDIIAQYGGSPANFLDVGGGVSAERMALAVRLVLSQGVRGIVVNAYGGINNCYMMAQGVCQAFEGKPPSLPIVVKMRGHFEEEGWALLAGHGIPFIQRGSTDEAVKLLLRLVEQQP